MRFGIFYEHQLPRPWEEDSEARLIRDALQQIELADRLGFDVCWEVEHHFLEEYSHSSAPEVFLAAASQRTSRIRLGHGIVLMPPGYNAPARIAERIAMLDLVSGGRVEFGTGESGSQSEMGGFGVDRDQKRDQWAESLDIVTRMFVEEPFAGYDGVYTSMPPRNVIPKPVQKPHPPLWVACSRRDTILLAAEKGIGALAFSFVEPEAAREWVDAYYSIIQSERCVPGGFAVNPNVAIAVPLMCHEDEQTAIQRGIDGAHFFGYSLAYYYVFGEHRPAAVSVWDDFQRNRDARGFARHIVNADQAPLGVKLLQQGLGSLRGAVGTPAQITELVSRYEAAGIDQIIFVSQAGRNQHEHICESLEVFGREVLPRFAEHADRKDEARRDRLAEACTQALARREPARRMEREYVIRPLSEGYADEAEAGGEGAADSEEVVFAAIVRNRTDAELEEMFGAGPALGLVFEGMERAFQPAKAKGFSGRFQYVLSADGTTRNFVLNVADGTCRATEELIQAPTVTLSMRVCDFARMVTGELPVGKALIESKLMIDGDFAAAQRLGEVFGRSGG
jgi:alkanesulfonate monooxygenase SsuD/methylene tetrahydromethanopterin reductase-like flavin-dependent oxidoreductase (luciferase family)/putative sterol carrier protein